MNATPPPASRPPPVAGPERPPESLTDVQRIPVLQEELEVKTQQVHTGTVRVRKVLHERQQTVSAPGYRDRVETHRVLREQAVSSEQGPWQDGETLVVPVYEERWVRQLFLVEEIQLRRHREQVDDGGVVSLRWEEVIVERLDPETQQWTVQAAPKPP